MGKNKKPFKVKISPKSTQHSSVLVDVSFPKFVSALQKLNADDQERIIATIEKIQRMTWGDVYKTSSKTPGQKRGLNFEPLEQRTRSGVRIATIRVGQKMRARVCRKDQFMIFISIHPDHDSAYGEKGGEDV